MRDSRHAALTALAAIAFLVLAAGTAQAQLAGSDTSAGDSCAGIPEGATRMTADANQDGAQVVLICDGTTWNAMAEGGGEPTGCPNLGDVCADGSVYAGLSPDGNVKMYTTPADAGQYPWNNGNLSGYVTTSQTSATTGETNTGNLITIDSDNGTGGTQPHQAAQYCADLTAHGQTDWYLPAKDELDVLYTNRAAIGGFNTSGTFPAGYYWSSSENVNTAAWSQMFSVGIQNYISKDGGLSVRCVRKHADVIGSAAGSDRAIQFNSGGTLGGDVAFIYTSAGNVGIGTASPGAPLHVDGEAIVGMKTLACASGTSGAIRYNSSTLTLEFCNGASWTPTAGSGGGADGQTMVAGWPDAIICTLTNPAYGPMTFFAKWMPYTDGKYWYDAAAAGFDASIGYNSDGSWSEYGTGVVSSNCAVSISTLVANGQAFNFANGAAGTAASMSDGTAGAPGLYFSADTNTGLYRPGTDILAAATGGVERLRFDSSGNVGIGTTTPSQPLTVLGETNWGVAKIIGNGTYNEASIGFRASNVSDGAIGDWVLGANLNGTVNTFGLYDPPLAAAVITVLASNGYVGIGTATPQAALDVAGIMRAIDDAAGCTTVERGAIRFNSAGAALELCDGAAWGGLGGGGASAIDDLTDAETDYTTDFNLFLGSGAGGAIAAGGQHNVFLGQNAGSTTTTGDANVYIGYGVTGKNTANGNVFIGYEAGLGDTGPGGNILIGQSAGKGTSAGGGNTFVGHFAGSANGGWSNTYFGSGAGKLRSDNGATENVFIGAGAGQQGVNGAQSVIIGNQAGYFASGSNQTIIGYRAGYGVNGASSGANNIFIGYQAGDNNTTGSNNIILGNDIDNATATTSNYLNIGDTIYGELSTDSVGIGTSSPQAALDVAGGIKVANDVATCVSAKNGTIRYVSGGDPPWEYCDGSAWLPFESAAAAGGGIGSSCGGGVVAGQMSIASTVYDLIATTITYESSGMAWGPAATTTGATSADGAANTATLVGLAGSYPAAEYCDSLAAGGKTDWYLPSEPELSLVIANRFSVGDISTSGEYTSSTEEGSNDRRVVWDDTNGLINSGGDLKSATSYLVRCIRREPEGTCAAGGEPTGCNAIGDLCSDGSVFAGLSPDGNVKMYTTPADAPGTYTWNNGTASWTVTGFNSVTDGDGNTAGLAALADAGSPYQAPKYCADLDAHGHQDWHLPARDEVGVLYFNQAAIGGFNTSGSLPAGYYWSSTEDLGNGAKTWRFSDGSQFGLTKDSGASVRCVRR